MDTTHRLIEEIKDLVEQTTGLRYERLVKPEAQTEDEEQTEGEKWIQKAIKRPGALHKQLHVPADKNIPKAKLQKAAHAGGKEGKRARLALTLKKLRHR